MMKPKKPKRQKDCDVAKLIDKFEQSVSMAVTIHDAIEPVIRAIVTSRRKTETKR